MTTQQTIRIVLIRRLADIQASIEHTTLTSGVVELDQTANGRLARMDAMQQAEMGPARLSRLKTEQRKHLAALARLDNDEYGICCRCGDEIAAERLLHDPATPFCIAFMS